MELKKRIQELMYEFVGTKTDTGSEHENNIIHFFNNWFRHVESIAKTHGTKIYAKCQSIPNDHLDRVVPWALLKGSGDDTVVLIHHCDTVDTIDYKNLADIALNPVKITQAFKNNQSELASHVVDDLNSGDWIFGRGVADMKGGGAVHMALFEEYAKMPDFKGNILLLSLVDEENLSAGARAAASIMLELKNEHRLNYKLTLDVESHERDPLSQLPIIHSGSIGKVMPVAYVRGKLAHGGFIFKGLNPVSLLSEIVRRTELSPDFVEVLGNTASPPPAWLYFKDSKKVYDVSLPDAAIGYMNVLTLEKTPMDIMDILHKESVAAFNDTIERMKARYEAYKAKAPGKIEPMPDWQVKVIYFADLYKQKESTEGFIQAFNRLQKKVQMKLALIENYNSIDAINELIEMTLNYSSGDNVEIDNSPVVVLALSPPYYPAVSLEQLERDNALDATKINELLKTACAEMKDKFGEDYTTESIYTGISDLSYAMHTLNDTQKDDLQNNMLLWDKTSEGANEYYIPFDKIKEVSTPVLNIGPWGKDIHKYTERVYLPDLYEKTPYLTNFIIKSILG